jgi:CDP-diacylglycerol--glycerol-3-phosphate 3-phosphatidyltransferase
MTTSTPAPEASHRAAALPLALTIFRLLAAPLIVGLILWGHAMAFSQGPRVMGEAYAAALLVFLLAAFSDLADGWLARRRNAVTAIGAALDHAADKALTALTLIAMIYAILPLALVIPAMILIGRDIAVAGLREGLADGGTAPPVSFLGKIKAFIAMAGIGCALAHSVLAAFAVDAALITFARYGAYTLLWAAAAVALWSGWGYLASAVRPRRAPPSAD